MKLLVCGGRDFSDWTKLETTLDKILKEFPQISLLIHGTQRGADTLARNWAIKNSIPHQGFPPNWNKYGTSAGPIRNQQMLDEGRPDLVIAFPTGGPGTKNMISLAKRSGIMVRVF